MFVKLYENRYMFLCMYIYERVLEIPLSPTFFFDLLMTAHKVSCELSSARKKK